MNSIRVRLASIMVISITVVVCFGTMATLLLVGSFEEKGFVQPIARQLALVAGLAESQASGSSAAHVTSSRVAGRTKETLSRSIESAMAELAERRAIVVTAPVHETGLIASVEVVPGRWLAVPIPDEPHLYDLKPILIGWGFILVGTISLSLIAARRVTRPLALLEKFAGRIASLHQVEPIPETGPVEVRATAIALNRLSHSLRQAVESRMRLVAAAGHDLRTPLTRMRLRAEFLEESEREKWCQNIDELEQIADSAILLVKAGTDIEDVECVRLDKLVDDIATDLDAMGLSVRVGALSAASVSGQPLALTRALRNIIINSATHGLGAEVTIGDRDGRPLVVVEDRGPGIPEAMMGQVFEPFFRVDKGRRQHQPGAGLGLAIAREIFSRSGGELTLANRSGGGLRQVVLFGS